MADYIDGEQNRSSLSSLLVCLTNFGPRSSSVFYEETAHETHFQEDVSEKDVHQTLLPCTMLELFLRTAIIALNCSCKRREISSIYCGLDSGLFQIESHSYSYDS